MDFNYMKKYTYPKGILLLNVPKNPVLKNIITGRQRVFGYGFKDVINTLIAASRAQQDKSSLEVLMKPLID